MHCYLLVLVCFTLKWTHYKQNKGKRCWNHSLDWQETLLYCRKKVNCAIKKHFCWGRWTHECIFITFFVFLMFLLCLGPQDMVGPCGHCLKDHLKMIISIISKCHIIFFFYCFAFVQKHLHLVFCLFRKHDPPSGESGKFTFHFSVTFYNFT